MLYFFAYPYCFSIAEDRRYSKLEPILRPSTRQVHHETSRACPLTSDRMQYSLHLLEPRPLVLDPPRVNKTLTPDQLMDKILSRLDCKFQCLVFVEKKII